MAQFQHGIALRKARSLHGRICYEIVEAKASGDQSLAVRADDSDIIALWRSMARDKNLPLLIEHGDGHREAVHPMMGSIMLGPHRPQRRALLTRVF